ncbi:MAG: RHS repeat-associated core domain-containing protein, partial [bacterium]
MNWPLRRRSGFHFRAAIWLALAILLSALSAYALPGDGNLIDGDLFNFRTYNPFPEKPFDVLSNGERIDTYTAGLTISKADISIPGRTGRNLEIGRTYSSEPQVLNQFDIVRSDNYAITFTKDVYPYFDIKKSIVCQQFPSPTSLRGMENFQQTMLLDPLVPFGKIVWETSTSKLKNKLLWYPAASQGMQLWWGDYAGIILITYVFPYAAKDQDQHVSGDRIAYLVRNDGTLELFDYAGNDISPTGRSKGLMRYFIGTTQVATKPYATCLDAVCDDRRTELWTNDNVDGIEYVDASGRLYVFKAQYGGVLDVYINYCENGVRESIIDNSENKPTQCLSDVAHFYRVEAFRLSEETDAFNNKRDYVYSEDGKSIDIQEMLGSASRHIQIKANDDFSSWSVCGPSLEAGEIKGKCDSYARDANGRITSYENRAKERTNIIYDPAKSGLPFSTPLHFAPSMMPQDADNPASFIELQYPTGGVLRYEQYGALQENGGGSGSLHRTVLMTLWPDGTNAADFLQKEVITDPPWEGNSGANRLTVSYNIDGSETGYLFGKTGFATPANAISDVTFLKKKILRTSSQPAFSLASSCEDTTCIQEVFDYAFGIGTVGDRLRVFARGVSRHALRYGGVNFITTANYTDDFLNLNPVSVTRPDGALTEYTYPDTATLTIISPFTGPTDISFLYPAYPTKRVDHFVTADGTQKKTRNTSYTWGGKDSCGLTLPAGALASSVIADGNEMLTQSFCYDSAGNVTNAIEKYSGSGGSADTQNVSLTYDERDLYPISKTINGVTWQYVYDATGKLMEERNANNAKTSFYYDAAGRVWRVVYGTNGSFKEYKYDLIDTDADRPSVTITRFDQVRAVKTVDKLKFDGLGRPVEKNKDGIQRYYEYDDRGFLHKIKEGGSYKEYSYDGLDRISHVASSDTGTVSYSYDVVSAGWVLGQPAAAVRRSAFVAGKDIRNRYFSIDGKLLRDERILDDGSSSAINYGYDALGNLIRKVGPQGLTSTWTYDGLSRISATALPTGLATTVDSWSTTGKPHEIVYSTGQHDVYTYDSISSRIRNATFGGNGISYVLNYKYDATDPGRNGSGRLASISDDKGNETQLSYDPSGSPSFFERTIKDLDTTYRVGAVKDSRGRLYRLTYSDGRAVYYMTDEHGRISQIRTNSLNGPIVADFVYDARNRLSGINYGNGVKATYRYVGDLLVEVLIGKGGQELYHVEYSYDARGRRIEAIYHDSSRTTYAYDDADRLIEADYFRANEETPHDKQKYTYDADGNRTTYEDSFKKLTYAYDAHGLLTEANYANGDGWRYSYDGFGRLTERKHVRTGQQLERQSFTWNNAGQLIRVETLDGGDAVIATHDYAYDSLGRREKRTRAGSSEYALYGEQIDALSELNSEGEVDRDFIYMEGRRVASLDGERIDFFHVDEIGSTLLTTDEDGKVTSGYRYDPFGNVNFSIGNGKNQYRFAGKHYDDETGFIYFGGRYYDPLIGRFISPDPMSEGINPYSYVNNNPFGARDVFGWYLSKAEMWGGSFSKDVEGRIDHPYDPGDPDPPPDGNNGGESDNPRGGDTGQGGGDGDDGDHRNDMGDDPDDIGDAADKPKFPSQTFQIPGSGFILDYGNWQGAGNLSQLTTVDVAWNSGDVNVGNISPSPLLEIGGSDEGQAYGGGPVVSGAPANDGTGTTNDNWADSYPPTGTSYANPDIVEEVFVGGNVSETESAGGLAQSADTANRVVQDGASSRSPDQRLVDKTDPITLHNAEVLDVERALKTPGRGMDFEFVRTYRSRIEYDGPMGYNWDHNFNKRLLKVDHAYCDAHPLDTCCTDVEWKEKPADYVACYIRFDGNARYDAYKYDEAGNYFKAPYGYFDRLVKHDDGTVTIRDRQGVTNHYAADGPCTAIEDRFGNRMELIYEGSGASRRLARVIDTLGRAIEFRYSGKHLVEVEDFAGRKLRFGFDGSGNLVSATKPATAAFPNGTTNTYKYTSGYPVDKEMLNHNLVSVTDSLGQTYVEFAYSFSDRVVWHRFGDGIFTIQSTMMGAWPECQTQEDVNRVASRTRIIDRNGNERLHEFNCQGNALAIHKYTRGLRQDDPAEFLTRYTYDLNGLTTSVAYPEGNREEVAYQQMQSGDATVDRLFAANPVSIKRVPDAARGGTSVETSISYEPLAMQPLTETKAGLTRTRWYDYQEGVSLSQLASAMRISETIAAAVFANVPLSQGDLNADADTSGMQANAVRIDEPNVHDLDNNEHVVQRFMRYNDHGQVVSEIDPVGTETRYSYYALGYQRGMLEQKVVDPAGLALGTSYEYDAAGNATKVTDASGAVLHNAFDERGRVLEITDAAGAITKNTYDAEGNLVRVDRPGSVEAGDLWITSKMTYNMLNRPILQEDETTTDRYVVTELRYDPGERLTRVIRPLGNSAVTDYDERDLVIRVHKGAASSVESVEERSYDRNGNLVEVMDGAGGITRYKYDGLDRVIDVTDPVGNRTLTQYDAFDRPVAISKYGPPDPGGDPQTLLSHQGFIYDELGRKLAKRDYAVVSGVVGANHETSFAYDAAGRKVMEEDALGNASYFEYDAAGRPVRTIDAAGNEVLTAYDGMARPVEIKRRELDEAAGVTREYIEKLTYDGMGRAIAHQDALGHVERSAYDGRGNLIWKADAKGAAGLDAGGDAGAGNITRYSYDGLNRMTKLVQEMRSDGAGSGALIGTIQTLYAWDDNGNSASITDANGNTTTYQYDAQDRRIVTELPDGATYRVEYDGAGRPARETDPRGIVVRKVYDLAGHMTLRTATMGSSPLRRDEFAYDGLGRMREAKSKDGNGTIFSRIEEGFDAFGRNDISKQDGIAVTRTFDATGRVLGVSGQNGISAIYVRDEIGRISTVSEASLGIIAKPSFVGPARHAKVEYGNGLAL